jgi:alkaline phosphatase
MKSLGHDIDVVLIGGPDDLPEPARRTRASADEAKIKVLHRGGYEHFERADSLDENGEPVFRWTMRTRVAE